MNTRKIITKIGLIVAIISGLATIGGFLNEVTKPKSALTAMLYQDNFYIPPQFIDNNLEYFKKIDWDKIFNSIDNVDLNGDLEQKKQLTNTLVSTMRLPFSPPFDQGLESYKTKAFIYIKNNGDAIAKDVYVDYPDKVLLMVEDDKGDESHPEAPTSRYKIPSIRQGGHYKIWAWSKSDNFNKYKIKIGDENQIANLEFGEYYYGKTGRLISSIEENITLFIISFGIIVISMIYLIFIIASSLFKRK